MTEKLLTFADVLDGKHAYTVNLGWTKSSQDFVVRRIFYLVLPPILNDPTESLKIRENCGFVNPACVQRSLDLGNRPTRDRDFY